MQITGTNSNLLRLKRTFTDFCNHSVGKAEVKVAIARVGPQVYIFIGSLPHCFPSFSLHGGARVLVCLLSETRAREFRT